MFLCCKKPLRYIFLKISEENLPVNLLCIVEISTEDLFCFFL